MSKVAVYIGTTQGPVQVQRIVEEGAAFSVVCLDRTSQDLPISAAYDRFVREGTGVIEREIARGPFRVDVSAPIDNGDSWQLGMLAAHGLHVRGELADRDDTPAEVWWLTGGVDHDLRVRPVSHVAEKLHRSAALLERLSTLGTPHRVIVPPGNATDAPPDLRARIEEVADARDLLHARAPAPIRQTPVPPRHGRSRRWHWRTRVAMIAIATGAVVATGAAAVPVAQRVGEWQAFLEAGRIPELDLALTAAAGAHNLDRLSATLFRYWLAWQTSTPAGAVEVALYERRPPEGMRTCAAVEFAGAEPALAPVGRLSKREFAASTTAGVCGLELRVVPSGERLFIGALLEPRPADAPAPPAPEHLSGKEPLAAPLRWQLPIDRAPGRSVEYQLLVIAGRSPVHHAISWIGTISGGGDAIERLRRYGVVADVYTFRLS